MYKHLFKNRSILKIYKKVCFVEFFNNFKKYFGEFVKSEFI